EEARGLGFRVEDEGRRAAHLFGLRVPPGTDPGTLRDALEERSVAVSLRGSAVRVSPNVYNEPRDVEALTRVLRGAAGGE
ncbi:MAG TPA: hypothetical protein VLL48_03685, partial [Longimicrobiales bacterium]|nr:hypothetical protein [Longimicrobiales bacterium]